MDQPEESYKSWKKICQNVFEFLTKEYGFSFFDEKYLGTYAVGFNNKFTCVKILFAPTRMEFGVYLGKLGEGTFCDLLEVAVVEGAVIGFPQKGFLAHLNRNTPDAGAEMDYNKDLRIENLHDEVRLQKVLEKYVLLLKKYSEPVLRGDFEIFDDVRIAKEKGPILKF